MKKLWLVLVSGCLMSTAAYAKSGPQVDYSGDSDAKAVAVESKPQRAQPASELIEGDCKHLRHTVNVTEVAPAKSFIDARAQFDKKLELIRAYAGKHNFKRLGLISLDYDLNDLPKPHPRHPDVPDNVKYRMHASYVVDSQDDAVALGDYLLTKKLNVSIGAHNPCNANDTPDE